MLKKIAFKIVKWLGFAIAFLLILIAILLSLLRFTTPYLQSHNQQIEAWTSGLLGYPMKIGTIEAGYFDFDPVITLHNVTVLDRQDKTELFKLHRLSIGIDLVGSLLKRHVEAGLLVIDGATIDLYQTKDGKIHWSVFDEESSVDLQKTQDNQEDSHAILSKISWLLTQGKVVLNNVNIIWQPVNGKIIRFDQVKFRLINGFIYNKLVGQGNIQVDQKNSSIRFLIRFRGNILESTSLSMIKGGLTLNNFTLNLNDFSPQNEEGRKFLTKFFPQKGSIGLRLHKFNFNWNKLWEKSRTFDSVDSRIEWKRSNDGQWLLKVKSFKMDNADLQVSGDVELSFNSESSIPICDLHLNFTTKFLETFSKYFPDQVLPKGVISWLNQAFKGGVASGTIILQGALGHFPFVNHDGSFLVNVDLKDIAFHYQNAWPMLNHLNGKLDVSGKSMSIVADTAEIADVPVYHVTAVIPDLVKAVLQVNSQIYSDSEKGLRFLLRSPLKENFGKGLENAFLQGMMRLSLKLTIPIAYDTGVSTQVFGALNFNDNTLILADWGLTLHNIYGNLSFTEDSVNGSNIKAILFGDPMELNISTLKQNNKSKYKVAFTGTLDIDNLQQSLDFPFNHYLQGSTDYDGMLTLVSTNSKDNNTLEVNSRLQGIAIYVPPLIRKLENETKKTSINLSFTSNSPKKDMIVNYNNEMSAALSFKKTANKTQFIGGLIDLSNGRAKISQKIGLFITANFGKADWSEWKSLLFSGSKNGEIKLVKDWLSQIDLKISELRAFGQLLHAVKLSISPHKQSWDVSIQSPNIVGTIAIPSDFSRGVLGGHLQKAYLQSSDDKKSKKAISPKELPSLNFAIDDFRYGDKALGKVVIRANSIGTGLNISQLQILSTNFQLDATGKWEQFNGINKSFLNGKCSSKNVGNAFKQLNFTESMKNGVGAANFGLAWLGDFYDLDLPSLNGNISVDIRNGRIVNLSSSAEAGMGFGRLLSILSLQTLPRRLSLDFSDLVKDGFSFDILRGTLKFVNGDAFTQDMQLNGPVAQVAVKGRIGFAAKDLDMKLIVVPQVTSSLPLIMTIFGTPVIGAGVWLANQVIGNQVSRVVASYAYKVTGLWANPNIQKL